MPYAFASLSAFSTGVVVLITWVGLRRCVASLSRLISFALISVIARTHSTHDQAAEDTKSGAIEHELGIKRV